MTMGSSTPPVENAAPSIQATRNRPRFVWALLILVAVFWACFVGLKQMNLPIYAGFFSTVGSVALLTLVFTVWWFAVGGGWLRGPSARICLPDRDRRCFRPIHRPIHRSDGIHFLRPSRGHFDNRALACRDPKSVGCPARTWHARHLCPCRRVYDHCPWRRNRRRAKRGHPLALDQVGRGTLLGESRGECLHARRQECRRETDVGRPAGRLD